MSDNPCLFVPKTPPWLFLPSEGAGPEPICPLGESPACTYAPGAARTTAVTTESLLALQRLFKPPKYTDIVCTQKIYDAIRREFPSPDDPLAFPDSLAGLPVHVAANNVLAKLRAIELVDEGRRVMLCLE